MSAPFAYCTQKVKARVTSFAFCRQEVKVCITAVCLLYTKSQSVYYFFLPLVDKKSKIVLLPFASCRQKVKDLTALFAA